MENVKVIQWYPGHMTRTKRQIEKTLPLVDMVIELRDARIPESSRNPDLQRLTQGKPRLVILNKADMADSRRTAWWKEHLKAEGLAAEAMDCRSGRGTSSLVPAVRSVMKEQLARWQSKGMGTRPVRAMVLGIPNVGKSSFINRMARGDRAKVEDRPGVTRGNQWFTVSDGLQLLDTPGVLWPKLEDQTAAAYLAYTGAIRDAVLDGEELACGLLTLLAERYPELLAARYKLTPEQMAQQPWELLETVARRRGMLISGGEADTERAATMLLDEFRGGMIGKITLE